MAKTNPLSPEERLAVQEKLLRVLKGEVLLPDELPDTSNYQCRTCQDTGFVVEKRFDGVRTGARCGECRARVDAEIRKNSKFHVEDEHFEPPPPPRDFRKIAGDDLEE